jgi:tetratricopeptide (TPR) repeat protein
MPIKVFPRSKAQAPEITGKYWLALAQEYLNAKKFEDALNALQQAERLLPLDQQVYRLQAEAFQANAQHAEALAAGMAAAALEENPAVALSDIGTAYFTVGQFKPASKWYRLALMLDPDLAVANQNLALMLRHDGFWREADYHYERSYRRQSLFIDPAETPLRSILILCSARPGSVPFDYLIPQTRNTRLKWVIAYSADRELPPYDIVFNAIGDADIARHSRAEVDNFLALNDKPLLNRPERVALTTRDHIGALLNGIEGIYVPAVARWNRLNDSTKPETESEPEANAHQQIAALIAEQAMTYPVIVRPVGGHGGEGVVLLESPQDTAAVATSDETYLISYCEYRSNDGYFRKYRVIFVDRKPYPYHLAISPEWLAHYDTADMLNPGWKLLEEAGFLGDPIAVLGQAGWDALEAIAQRIDLDYCGIDFSVLPDGRLVIFEANATMLVHPESDQEALKFKNWYVQNIFDAFDRLLDRRIADAATPVT